jgi:imidazolonepropionase-like amidohydrolase
VSYRNLVPSGHLLRGMLVLLVSSAVSMHAPASVSAAAHAIVGATVVVRPGEVIEDATVVVRDDRIVAVGPSSRISVPPDARVWAGEGLRVHAGFFEPWYEVALPEIATGATEPRARGGGRPSAATPEQNPPDPGLPGPSSGSSTVHPERRAVDGLALSADQVKKLREAGFTVAAVVPKDGVLRGRTAVVHLGDALPEQRVLLAEAGVAAGLRSAGWGGREYPSSSMGMVTALRQSLLDARHYRDDQAHYAGNATKRARPAFDPALEALVPVIEGRQPLLVDPDGIVLAHRAYALAREVGVRAIVLGTGGEWRRPDLVPDGAALVLPIAFPSAPEVVDEADWIDVSLDELRHWDFAPEVPAMLVGRGQSFAITTRGLDSASDLWSKLRAASQRGWNEAQALDALTVRPATYYGLSERLGTVEPGKLACLTVLRGEGLFDAKAEVAMLFVDGEPIVVKRPGTDDEKQDEKQDETESDEVADEASQALGGGKGPEGGRPIPARLARAPHEDRGPLASPRAVLVRGATIWTSAPEGVLENADLLVRDGRIAEIGRGLSAPTGAMEIDGTGKHVTAGLIDAHSHIAVIGGVNEGTMSTTAQVRIADVLNSEDPRIYEQLAGGLTTSHIMHGSANAIGGQCQTIKLRWGASPDEIVFAGARPTIKFALGENPKRSNWTPPPGTPRRYPQTRMGVEDVIRERFAAAAEYVHEQRNWKAEQGPAPRRDLQLEALAQILADERDIHCHSYRQDEILALIRLMEEFEARVAVFQHVLEGYKVADEVREHGSGASSFADWWAYKYEVIDAIPHNTTILDDRGVLTTVNSDSPDLARRMNTEAAKSVRYGGSDEQRALNMVTINAARQLGIDDRTGSIELGKDADFVVWNDHPLSTRAVAVQTWVDGKLYWDLERDAERQTRIEAERTSLISRAKEAEKRPGVRGRAGSPREDDPYRYEMPQELWWASFDEGCSADHAHHAQEGH